MELVFNFMIQLPDYPFAAYIFDCDGTLVDTMPTHYACWVDALKKHGANFEFTEEEFYFYAGYPELRTVEILNQKYGSTVDPVAMMHDKSNAFIQHIAAIQKISPVAEVALRNYGRLPMSVASGSEKPIVKQCLTNVELIHLFDHIITPEDVVHGKPSPDMFLLAAEKMGVKPQDCLVFEDGQSGLDAAKAAGMQAVYIPKTLR